MEEPLGLPLKTIIVEPLELPEPLRKVELPEKVEQPEPEKVPVHDE